VDIRWLGHASFELTSGSHRAIIDPYLAPDNPAAVVGPDEVEPTDILLTHGHGDHAAHAVDLAKRTGARCVALTELARWLAEQGVGDVADPNLGGTAEREWGWVKVVQAFHTNTLPEGPPPLGLSIGHAAGLVIYMDGTTVYHLGDTALFGDLSLIAERTPVNVALVPIGGHFTMDQEDAVTAVELIDPDVVIPMHYGTFPAIEADPQRFASDVEASARTSCEVVVLEPGGTHTV
jgi:L-ascorbate metabolism protein UlaG (beta-lactamase superfamily)